MKLSKYKEVNTLYRLMVQGDTCFRSGVWLFRYDIDGGKTYVARINDLKWEESSDFKNYRLPMPSFEVEQGKRSYQYNEQYIQKHLHVIFGENKYLHRARIALRRLVWSIVLLRANIRRRLKPANGRTG